MEPVAVQPYGNCPKSYRANRRPASTSRRAWSCALLVIGLCSAGTTQAGFFKCIDVNGEMQYQQEPCARSQQEKKVHVYVGPRDASEMGWQAYESVPDEPALAAPHQTRALFANAMSDLSGLKVRMMHHHQDNGVWPTTLKELQLDAAEMRSSRIEKVELGTDGAIAAWLKPIFGKDKKIVLRPAPAMSGTTLEWKCQANFPRALLSSGGIDMCESRAVR